MKRLLILERDDLTRNSMKKDIRDVLWVDFRYEVHENIRKFDMVIFQDDDGSMRVIKSRYPMRDENEIF